MEETKRGRLVEVQIVNKPPVVDRSSHLAHGAHFYLDSKGGMRLISLLARGNAILA